MRDADEKLFSQKYKNKLLTFCLFILISKFHNVILEYYFIPSINRIVCSMYTFRRIYSIRIFSVFWKLTKISF